jgi:hypothetical protein
LRYFISLSFGYLQITTCVANSAPANTLKLHSNVLFGQGLYPIMTLAMNTNIASQEQFVPQFQIPNPAQRETHELKTWPSCFAAVKAGSKPFDVR